MILLKSLERDNFSSPVQTEFITPTESGLGTLELVQTPWKGIIPVDTKRGATNNQNSRTQEGNLRIGCTRTAPWSLVQLEKEKTHWTDFFFPSLLPPLVTYLRLLPIFSLDQIYTICSSKHATHYLSKRTIHSYFPLHTRLLLHSSSQALTPLWRGEEKDVLSYKYARHAHWFFLPLPWKMGLLFSMGIFWLFKWQWDSSLNCFHLPWPFLLHAWNTHVQINDNGFAQLWVKAQHLLCTHMDPLHHLFHLAVIITLFSTGDLIKIMAFFSSSKWRIVHR